MHGLWLWRSRDSCVRGACIVIVLTCVAAIASAAQLSHPLAYVEHGQVSFRTRPLWSQPGAGGAHASLISDGKQLIFWAGSGVESYSLDGKVRWKSAIRFGPPLAAANGNVYAVDREERRIVAIDLKTGRNVWHSRPIANLDVDGEPELSRILVNSKSLTLCGPGLAFVDLETGRVRVADQEGLGLIFSEEAVRNAQLVDGNLFIVQAYDGARLETTVAQYDAATGQRVWESPNSASRFWIRDNTVIVAADPDPIGPWFSYSPVSLATRILNGQASPLHWNQATFSPDPPAKLVPVSSSSLTPTYVAWPYLVIVANERIYRYDLHRVPAAQSPVRLDTEDPILGMLENGTFVLASQSALRLVNLASMVPEVARVSRVVLSDVLPFPTFIPLDNAAALTDAAGVALIFDGGKRVVDITSSCRTLITAADVEIDAIAAVCKNGSRQTLEMFGSLK